MPTMSMSASGVKRTHGGIRAVVCGKHKKVGHVFRGTGLRYSFDIKRGGVTQEVGVDAQTGKILENKKEGPHPD